MQRRHNRHSPAGYGAGSISGTRESGRGTRPAWRAIAFCLPLLALFSAASASADVPTTPLPDGRAWEMVSPAEKGGASVDPLGFGVSGLIGGLIVASEEGNAITYVANAPVTPDPEGNRAIEGNQVLAKRSPAGWSAKDIVTPHNNGEGFAAGTNQEYQSFSADLSLSLVAPFGFKGNPLMEPPLLPGVESEERSVYLRHNSTCEGSPASCYEPLVNEQNVTGTTEGVKTKFGGEVSFLSASADLNHDVVKSPLALTTATAPEGGLYEWNAGQATGEQLQLISVLPNAKPGTKDKVAYEPQLGNDVEGVSDAARNAVSRDGSRTFWAAFKSEASEIKNLYMRDTKTAKTIQLDAEEGFKAKGTKTAQVHFQTASADGSRVFFTDSTALNGESKLTGKEGSPFDLYVCEIAESDETAEATQCPKGKLTDLTGEKQGFTGPGDVVGAVLGSSADGTTVYFVANGAEAGGTTGTCPNPNESQGGITAAQSCNLYMAHFNGSAWEDPKKLAELSALDAPDWAVEGFRLSNLTARVSPNGTYLAFMSERSLTGYDNRDANPAAHEARDEEVFVYDSSGATSLTCASCNPNPAQRPTGVFDTERAGEGGGLIVDPVSFVWSGRWLAGSIPPWTALSTVDAPYQSRYLLDNGRLFFNSADALVSQDTNRRTEQVPKEGAPSETEATQVGVEDVYQYEPGGLGSCTGATACVSLLSSGTSEHESAFLDASASGNDVFFLTGQALLTSDIDSVFDVYDARICSEGSPCITPPLPPAAPCNGETSCRAGAPAPPAFGGTASETLQAVSSVGRIETLPEKISVKPKPKPLTRAQKLTKALKSCKKKNKHSKPKRAACERHARKRFGHKSKHKSKQVGKR